ncbi:MAG: BrxA/BrxB family bacilliredoxin [Flavobacteriales bacterium]
MYPPELVAPIREDLVEAGFDELMTAQEVDEVMKKEGTTLCVINSVCGCAARNARPAAKLSVQMSDKKPSNLVTVFAGVDTEAVEQARKYTLPYPSSSPSIALFKDGKLVHFLERHHIEGNTAEAIADNLSAAFTEFC